MREVIVTALLWAVLSVSAAAEYDSEAYDRFVRSAEANSVTNGGYWFELYNALGEWEKTMLIFGYADPGDLAACERVKASAEEDQPGVLFRCNPVHSVQ
ncbi:hypothetical protein K3722_07575 [Leisingera caerulea]|uniref:DUF4189 domain-containing protein n=1 Tax=Leisingera caerulea TaxID=506591 RepID=A0ABY5X0S3_LEICA|nr:hypothetical protein [Leisingera caerulea]UWQ59981.1 hypothetical protein K3722_07575 [Leisingera caerulea]